MAKYSGQNCYLSITYPETARNSLYFIIFVRQTNPMRILKDYLAFPASLLLAVAFVLAAYVLHRYYPQSKLVRALGSLRCSRVLLGIGAIGLAIEGTWSVPLHDTIPAAIFALVLLLSLSLTVLDGVRRIAARPGKATAAHSAQARHAQTTSTRPAQTASSAATARPGIPALLSHAGIALILFAALFGAPDVTRARITLYAPVPEQCPVQAPDATRARITVPQGKAVTVARTDDGLLLPLPFEVALEQFTIDHYPDGRSPRQYTSRLRIDGKACEVSVNHPLRHGGYTIYQDSYDQQAGSFTVLQLVRDPWLPLIFVGIALLAAGAIGLLAGQWKAKLLIPAVLVLTILFTLLSIKKIELGTLAPALRSWWFVPHLFVYMVAYSLMALALLVRLLPLREKVALSGKLLRSSSALLVLGMLCGSVWAYQAWGSCWAWDPKENWAAVTWILALVQLHLPNKGGWKAVTLLILAFLALQITWYGVNWLPSSINSLHTYNQ